MTILCLKGNRTLDLHKNTMYPVVDVFDMGKDFGHQLRIVIQKAGQQQTVYVPTAMKNIAKAGKPFNVNRGDPTKKAKMKFEGTVTVRTGDKT